MRLCSALPGGVTFSVGVGKDGVVLVDYEEFANVSDALGVNSKMRRDLNFYRLVSNESDFGEKKVANLRGIIDKIPSSVWGEKNPCGCYLAFLCRLAKNHPPNDHNPTNGEIPPDPPDLGFVRCAEVPLRNPQVQARVQYIRLVTPVVEGQIAQGQVVPRTHQLD